jgi:uncharacterized protein
MTVVTPNDRIESIDVIRGIALFGVIIVNLVTEFRVSIFQQFLEPTVKTVGIDNVFEKIVVFGFEAKAFCLFAILFGAGLAIQFDRLCEQGRPIYWLLRRLVVLLGFGLVHLLFIWNGDILTAYAVAGLLALPFLLVSTRKLLFAAMGFLALYALGPVHLYPNLWLDSVALKHHVDLANQIYPSGGLLEVRRFSLQELPLLLPLHFYVFPRTIALFLLGAWVWKVGVLKRPQDFRYQVITFLIIGILGGAGLAAADFQGVLSQLGTSKAYLIAFIPVLLALGYGASILMMNQYSIPRHVLSAFAPAGRMAFTNYLTQSMILSFIFFGYGLGQFGQLGVAQAFVMGVGIFTGQVVLSNWWLRHYRFGPIEWLWRSLMYGVVQPMQTTK